MRKNNGNFTYGETGEKKTVGVGRGGDEYCNTESGKGKENSKLRGEEGRINAKSVRESVRDDDLST